MSAWVYVTDTTTEQIIWCKEAIITGGVVSNRFCLKFKSGVVYAGINAASSTVAGIYTDFALGVTIAFGWNYVHLNVDVNGGNSRFQCYVMSPSNIFQTGT